ncbi:hypothetical protein PG984_011334 [Apiospora sp. TS-2023a]
MVQVDHLQFVLQLLEFDRIAHRHPNHRLVTARDLEIARGIARRHGLVFPSNQFISILELVDGCTSEQKVRSILETLRNFDRYDYPTPERDFGSDQATLVDSEEGEQDRRTPPVPKAVIEAEPKVPSQNGSVAPPKNPPPTTHRKIPSPPSWVARWVPTFVGIMVAVAAFGALHHHHQLTIEYVDSVVRALKQATPVSARRGLRGFHERFPYFVTGTTGADVFRCLTGNGLRDFDVQSKIAGREECSVILVADLQSAVPLAASAPDVPAYSEEDWERIASCLAWTTCEKGREWDALPLPEVPEDDVNLDPLITFDH